MPENLLHPVFDLEWYQDHKFRTLDDDWSGLASSIERRRRQNRINARAARRRKNVKIASSNAASGYCASSKELVNPRCSTTLSNFHRKDQTVQETGIAVTSTTQSQSQAEIQSWRLRKARATVLLDPHFQDIPFSVAYPQWFPGATLLHALVSYNSLRGLLFNMKLLGYDPFELSLCGIRWAFHEEQPVDILPVDLKPTLLQKTIPHHPIIDIIPDRHLRDQIILMEDPKQRERICQDLIAKTRDNDPYGLILWGQPFMTSSWEVTDIFFKRWHKLLEGSVELIESTNRWRKLRGEGALC